MKTSNTKISEIVAAEKTLCSLSNSGLPKNHKVELAEEARKIWSGWQVNINDIEFIRKPSGDRKLIEKGRAASVYLGRMKIRDINNDIIPGHHEEVAVKGFTVPRSCAAAKLPEFMREMFLRKAHNTNAS